MKNSTKAARAPAPKTFDKDTVDAASVRALRRAARLVGGFTNLAARLGASKNTPRMWLTRKRIPEGRCLEIEMLTGGRVRCEEQRPDLRAKWVELRRSLAARSQPDRHL